MARLSKIDRLPEKIQDLIRSLRKRGRTIDEILDKLKELDVDIGRSALGAHVQRLDVIAERLRYSRETSAVVEHLEKAGESKVARLNIELLQAAVMDLLSGADGKPVKLDPKSSMLVATTLHKSAQAKKLDAELILKLRKEFAEKAAEAATGEMKKAGLSAETIKKIETEILGIAR